MRHTKPSPFRVEQLEDRTVPYSGVISQWNELLQQSLPGTPLLQPLATRNMALVHVAVYDAVNVVDRAYQPYHARVPASQRASLEAAAAQAARDTLVALYPNRQANFDTAMAGNLAAIAPGPASEGVAIGREVARQVLALRGSDGATTPASYTPPNSNPGRWQPTLPDFTLAAGAHIGATTPFAITSSTQFRPAPPAGLTTAAYATTVNEARVLGARDAETSDRDGNGMPDCTPDQSQVGMIWRTPLPILQVWNRVAQRITTERGTPIVESARLFGQLNMAINDGL